MSNQNALALINMYRDRKVAAVRTPAGIQLMGVRNLNDAERRTLLDIPQADLEAALRWQK